MVSSQHNHPPIETSPSDNNPFDRLSRVVTGSIETLHNTAKPSKITTEIISLPFGQLRNGYLSAKISTANSAITSGYLRYDNRENPDESIHVGVDRELTVKTQRGQLQVSTHALAKWLDREWPIDKDNGSIRDLVDQEEISVDDLTDTLLEELAPTAPHLRTDETFTYNNPDITDLGCWLGDPSKLVEESVVRVGGNLYKLNDGMSVDITGVYIGDLLHRTDLTVTMPCEHDGLDANIVSKIRVSDIGDIIATCHLDDGEGNIRHIPIIQAAQFADEVSAVLEILLKEHQSLD